MGSGASRLYSSLAQTLVSTSTTTTPLAQTLVSTSTTTTPLAQTLVSTSTTTNPLAQTLVSTSTTPLAHHQDPQHPSPSQGCHSPPGGHPLELLRECEEALRDRPPRLLRAFICPGEGEVDREEVDNDATQRTIRVMQWNILAQALGEGMDSFVNCPLEALNWAERKYLILEEILTYRPHILCLQEVDHYYDTFQPILASLGYRGNFCPKPWSPCLDVEGNNGPDGCALFYDEARLDLVDSVNVRLCALLTPTNQVAVVTTLRCRVTGRRLCVAVTHLKARSGWECLRSAQGSDLLRNLATLTQSPGGPIGVAPDTPLLVCGDFNAVPSEDVYQRFASSPLILDSAYKRLSRDGLSEPAYTTWKIRPTGECCTTLDYIWYSREAFSVDAVLDMPTEEQIGPNRLPSYSYPSDHLSLVCDFSFKKQQEE
ncbi:nocturnin isoform X2 [Oncorhynchus tshawytscha]|nr:nocturnin isoform X2 [Oncorhynchus tshawytscha]XP_042170632.1 nocturnin isoform X2 [Oncorhynchus tshawytscha]